MDLKCRKNNMGIEAAHCDSPLRRLKCSLMKLLRNKVILEGFGGVFDLGSKYTENLCLEPHRNAKCERKCIL